MYVKMPLIWKPYSLIESVKTPQRTVVTSTNVILQTYWVVQILAKQFLFTPPWDDKPLTGKQISYDNLYTSRGADIQESQVYLELDWSVCIKGADPETCQHTNCYFCFTFS